MEQTCHQSGTHANPGILKNATDRVNPLNFFFHVRVQPTLASRGRVGVVADFRAFDTVSAQAHLRRPRMRLQAFAMRQGGGNPAQGLGTGFADFDQAAALLKVINPQRR